MFQMMFNSFMWKKNFVFFLVNISYLYFVKKKLMDSSLNYVSKFYLNYVSPLYILTEFHLFCVYANVEIWNPYKIQSRFFDRMKLLYNRADIIAEYQCMQ